MFTPYIITSILAFCKVYSLQLYVIQFSMTWGCFLRVLLVSSANNADLHDDINEILLKVMLNTNNLTQYN